MLDIFSLMNEVKNIIFDLGGVLLPVSYQAVIDAFSTLGVSDAAHFYSQKEQQPLFDKIERGEMSSGEFIYELKKMIPEATETQLIDAWNAILGLFPSHRLHLLELVKKNYRIFLLSNTTEIHINKVEHDLKRHNEVEDFSSYFDTVYLSYEVGYRKPEKEIYDLVLLENNLNAEETLFIEDTEKNVQGALAAGIPTLWLKVNEGMAVEDFFTAEGMFRNMAAITLPK